MKLMFKFIDKAADRPDRRVLVACFELINMRAKLIKTAYTDSLQTSQIMCRSVFHLFLVCRKTSLQTMKAMRCLLYTSDAADE